MAARRAVKAAKALGDPSEMKEARAAGDLAKIALGERGPVCRDRGRPDLNKYKATNTSYAEWYRALGESASS